MSRHNARAYTRRFSALVYTSSARSAAAETIWSPSAGLTLLNATRLQLAIKLDHHEISEEDATVEFARVAFDVQQRRTQTNAMRAAEASLFGAIPTHMKRPARRSAVRRAALAIDVPWECRLPIFHSVDGRG
jgi:hypothetical protein